MKSIIRLTCLLSFSFCTPVIIYGQSDEPSPEIIKWDALQSILNTHSDSVYVINFWATWCKPCVAELPSFDSLSVAYRNKPVAVILVSLDFKRQYADKLIPFIQKNNISARVLLLDEPEYDLWINKIDKSWSGAIPATLIFHKPSKYHHFYEEEFTYSSLIQALPPHLKN
ncbi:MAG TPA: TlpA disulfide reductase family protein [Bacteroidia bacterium]|nr:TlpA disulfide reductase family protein [Bacteroidia bacterium]